MAKYIDKAAVVAEIERRTKAYQENFDKADNKIAKLFADGLIQGLESFLAFLDTFEVKEVEEPNASDRGMAEEIIINLKRVEQDYRIDLTKEIEWLRNKVKKGE